MKSVRFINNSADSITGNEKQALISTVLQSNPNVEAIKIEQEDGQREATVFVNDRKDWVDTGLRYDTARGEFAQ